MTTNYITVEVFLTDVQQRKIQSAIKSEQPCTIRINPSLKGNSKLFLTQTQLNQLEKALKEKKSVDITFSKQQLKHQTGGFLPLIGMLAAKALPFIVKGALAGAATTAASKVVNKISGGGTKIIGKRYGAGSKNLKKRG